MSPLRVVQSLGMSTRTAPFRPVFAMWNAVLTAYGISSGDLTCTLYLVTLALTPIMSHSWKPSLPMTSLFTCPVNAATGLESIWALARPVTRFVAPGPLVAMHTPTLLRTRA